MDSYYGEGDFLNEDPLMKQMRQFVQAKARMLARQQKLAKANGMDLEERLGPEIRRYDSTPYDLVKKMHAERQGWKKLVGRSKDTLKFRNKMDENVLKPKGPNPPSANASPVITALAMRLMDMIMSAHGDTYLNAIQPRGVKAPPKS